MSTAAAVAKPEVIYRHAVLVRVTHWVNVLCLLVLLMSGLQIFNAHTTLYLGEKSDPDRAVLSMDAVQRQDGSYAGVTTIGSQEDSVVRFILGERGLVANRDFAVVAVGGAPTRLAALSKGMIHGSTFIPPQDIAAERLGLNPLIDMSTLGLYNPGSCFASTKSYIKSHRARTVPLTEKAREALREIKTTTPLGDARVFPAVTPHVLNHTFRAHADRIGRHDVAPHTLRHAFASALVRAGVDLSTVQRLMGHRSIAMTMRYGCHAPGNAADLAIRALEASRAQPSRPTGSEPPR